MSFCKCRSVNGFHIHTRVSEYLVYYNLYVKKNPNQTKLKKAIGSTVKSTRINFEQRKTDFFPIREIGYRLKTNENVNLPLVGFEIVKRQEMSWTYATKIPHTEQEREMTEKAKECERINKVLVICVCESVSLFKILQKNNQGRRTNNNNNNNNNNNKYIIIKIGIL